MKNRWVFWIAALFALQAFAQVNDTPPPSDDEETASTQPAPTEATEDGSAEPAAAPPLDVNLSGADVEVQVVGDSVIVTGVESDIALLEELAKRLDRDLPPQSFRVIKLQNKNAQEVATVIQQAMQKMIPREPRPEEAVTVQTISNTILLLTGPESRLDVAVRMVEQLDEVAPTLPLVATETMTYQLKNIKAGEAKTKLQQLIDQLRSLQGDDKSTQIFIEAVDASNSLLIIAPETEHDKIRALIEQLDVEPVQGYGDLRLAYFPLLHSDVNKLADVLNELLTAATSAEEVTETIRRLHMVKHVPGEGMIELPPINLQRQIKLIADEDSQALICATSEENIEPLKELIDLLDGVPIGVDQSLRVFPLKYADAANVKTLLEDMFQQGKELPREAPGSDVSHAVPGNAIGEALVYNLGVSADARTNTIIVTGRKEQLAMVEGLIDQIDLPSTEIKHPLRLVRLTKADATSVSKIIEELFTQREEAMGATEMGAGAIAREKVFLSVHLRSNSIIVSANDPNFDEIVSIAETLDAAPDRFLDQIRIINCSNTSAGDLKTKIDELWQRKAELRGESELPQDLPIVVADQRSNALVIASSPEDYDEIKGLVDQLEAQPLAPIAKIRLIELKNNDAAQIGDMLQQLFDERLQQRLAQGQEENPSDRVAVASDAATNTLLVASSKDNYDEMVKLVDALDVEPDLEGVVQIFVLQNAQAENVADRITELFDKGLYTGVAAADNQITQERQKVSLIADARSNAVVASASKTNLNIIKLLIEQMDTDKAPLLNADTRIFELAHADAVKVAGMLNQLFQGLASGAEGEFAAPTIVAEPVGNLLIITGARDAIKRASDLVASLDIEPKYKTAIRVYHLNNASAVRLTAKMQEVFDQRDQGTETEHTPVFLMADEATNSIIASASEEDHAMADHLIGLLDVPSNISRQVQIFPLAAAKAEPTATTLEQLFQSQTTTGGQGAGRADAIAVQPDRRTNSLIVWAAASEMENIAEVIQKLDRAKPGPEMMIRVIPLKRALAEELSQTLTDTINAGAEATADDSPAVILTFEDQAPDGTRVVRKLLRQDVTIQPDPRTNALFVMAPAASMEMLESLILSIDRIPPSLLAIRLFPLANADAEDIVDVLTGLFEAQTGQTEGPEAELQLSGAGGGGGAAAAGGTGEGSVPGQVLRFTANRRTNTVIAAGSETDLNMVEELIRKLDAQDTEERLQVAFEARYLPSTDIATALKEYYDEEDQLLQDIDEASSVQRRAERHVTVVADEESNSLLIGVSPRYYARTMDMLYSIDRPPPQVMIQVLIAEVTLDDSIEFGMEFALQDLLFSEHAVVGPNGVVNGHDFDFVGGTDVGAAGAAGSFGGFSFSITGEDFSFLLRALQSDGSLEVLSRPTIMVANNQEANITIGDRVPFLRSSNVSDSGQVNSTVEYEEVGIILNVTPHINPDGYVNLEVAPEISSLNQGSSVQISEGLTAPTFSKRSAETVVTVKDGETVVIGGLIQTQEDNRETKVPIFGDIPVMGNLFRATTNNRRRTELMIVLTTDVLRNEFDTFRESVKMRDQSGFLPDRIKRSPLMEGLRILPGEDIPEYLDERERNRQIEPNRPLYGPQPEIFGPGKPGKKREGSDTVDMETYGPPVGSIRSDSVVLSSSKEN